MGREKRVIFEGAVYHVITRANNREYIFENPKHKAFLLKQLKGYNDVFDFDLLAYAIMDNHYHLIVRANKTPISEIMFYINNVFSKYLSRELNRTGHIFEKRYTSKLITTDSYLVWLLRYIHRNPVRAGICETPDGYRWSSHYFYKQGLNSFIKTNFILSILCSTKAAAQLRYLDLVNMPGDDISVEKDQKIVEAKYDIRDLLISDASFSIQNPQKQRRSLGNIFDSMGLDGGLKQHLLSGSRKPSLTSFKLQFTQEALREKYTLREISTFLNTSANSLTMLLSRHTK